MHYVFELIRYFTIDTIKKINKHSLMNYNFIGLLLILGLVFVASCKKDDGLQISTSTQILSFKLITPAEREGIIDYASKKVNFTSFKPYTNISKVVVEITISSGATVSPASGDTIDFSNGPIPFTVTNGGLTSTYMVSVIVDPPSRVAFVGEYTLASQITELDAKTAYSYLKSQYGTNLIYLAFKNINEFTLEYVDVIYYYQDTDTTKNFGTLIPSIAKSENVVKALKKWHQSGGHFILAGHAPTYLGILDRLPKYGNETFENNPFRPALYNSKIGSWDSLQAGINFNLNPQNKPTNSQLETNNINQTIFTGLYTDALHQAVPIKTYLNYTYFPLQSFGFKENHFSAWDIASLEAIPGYQGLNNFQKAEKFEKEVECKILANSSSVTDMSSATVIEFKSRSKNTGEGTIIAIGDASYDWNQNPSQEAPMKPSWFVGDNYFNGQLPNTITLTTNCIDYLLAR